jgi:chemotaxis response regulator CheB
MMDLEPPPPVAVHRRGAAQGKFAVIGIGASTGGPQALATILRELPRDIPAAIVIVQHLDLKFVPGLQRWLAQECSLPIHLVGENTPVRPGVVYLAETDDHLIIRNTGESAARLQYVEDPEDSPHRPSVDAFFRSLAALRGLPRAGVLLTGMGRDGAAGLLALRRSDALTIAQDAASSVVYGMPRVAAEIGAVEHTTPLARISDKLIDFVVDVTLPDAKQPAYLEESY